MNKKDAIPVIIAAFVALVITALVKWLLPIPPSPIQQNQAQKKEISMPEIPLAIKKAPKKRRSKKSESFVLVVADSFKKNEKVDLKKLKWEKWPNDGVQPYFIAKDHQDKPLNNGADYSNALKMWAKSDIPGGVPLIMDMLTDEDPVKKAEAEKKKQAGSKLQKEAMEKAKLEKELEEARKEGMVRKGMRAITLSIDQKSATAVSILKPGDYVDVLIIAQNPGIKAKTYSYKGLRILALDGVTKFDFIKKARERAENKAGGNNGGPNNIGGAESAPKNVTLEVKEELLEEILSRAESNGVILSLRNPEDDLDEKSKEIAAQTGEATSSSESQPIRLPTFDPIVEGLLKVSKRASLGDVHIDEIKKQKKNEEENRRLMSSVLMANQIGIAPSYTQKADQAKQMAITEGERKLMNSFMISGSQASPSSKQLEEKLAQDKMKEEREKLRKSIIQAMNNPVTPTVTQLEEKAKALGNRHKENLLASSVLHVINNSNPATSEQLKERDQKAKREEETAYLVKNLIAQSSNTMLAEGKPRVNGFKSKGGRYEVVSGKIVGEEDEDEAPVATVYRKLTASTVEFDEDGRAIKKDEEAGSTLVDAIGGNSSGSSK